MHAHILILDQGSELVQLIARRIRQAGVYCEILPGDIDEDRLRSMAGAGLRGVIISDTHSATPFDQALPVQAAVFELGVPVLAIGHGMHAMATHFGGQIARTDDGSQRQDEFRARGHTRLLDAIQDRQNAQGHGLLDGWAYFGTHVSTLPEGFRLMASSQACPIAGIADEARGFYGLQFHPEVTRTPQGPAILARFAQDICQCPTDWNMSNYADEAIARIRAQVGNDHVILGLSGGVDSSVAAALIHEAIGDQLTCVFVDHGLLRLHEADQVMDTFADHLGIKVIHIDASAQFMQQLAGVADPEAKRKIIGREFIEVFQAQAGKISEARWLAQGTIYPDVIESSSSGKGVAVKSHHNVGGLPETLNLQLLEPLRNLFKDEVRELGIHLGLPPAMVYRHPFPGPGLGVRILGAVSAQPADILRRADAIFIEELRNASDPDTGKTWYELTSQAFAVFLPVRSVGVSEGGRSYENVVALRAVITDDFMTARWAELPHALLARVSTRIINEVDGINRVVYDVSSKPPATIEWE